MDITTRNSLPATEIEFEFVGVNCETTGLKQESGEELVPPIKEEMQYDLALGNVAGEPGSFSSREGSGGAELECKEEMKIKTEITVEENPIICATEESSDIARNSETQCGVEEQDNTSTSYTEHSSHLLQDGLPGSSETGTYYRKQSGCDDSTTALYKNIASSWEQVVGYPSTSKSIARSSEMWRGVGEQDSTSSSYTEHSSHLSQRNIGGPSEAGKNCNNTLAISQDQTAAAGSLHTHKTESFSCLVCSAKFAHASYLSQHLLTHASKEPLSCTVCSAKFIHKDYLNRHFLTHPVKKDFSCAMCPAKFIYKSFLDRHVLTHYSNKLFSCSVCPAKFLHKVSLEKHSLVHTGGKQFSCTVCPATFYHEHTLKQHILTHS